MCPGGAFMGCRSYRKDNFSINEAAPFPALGCGFFSSGNHRDAGSSWLRRAESGVRARALCGSGTGSSSVTGGWGCRGSAVPGSGSPSLHSVWATRLHGCCRIFMWGWLGVFRGVLIFCFACCQETNLNLQPIHLSHVVLHLRGRVIY